MRGHLLPFTTLFPSIQLMLGIGHPHFVVIFHCRRQNPCTADLIHGDQGNCTRPCVANRSHAGRCTTRCNTNDSDPTHAWHRSPSLCGHFSLPPPKPMYRRSHTWRPRKLYAALCSKSESCGDIYYPSQRSSHLSNSCLASVTLTLWSFFTAAAKT